MLTLRYIVKDVILQSELEGASSFTCYGANKCLLLAAHDNIAQRTQPGSSPDRAWSYLLRHGKKVVPGKAGAVLPSSEMYFISTDFTRDEVGKLFQPGGFTLESGSSLGPG